MLNNFRNQVNHPEIYGADIAIAVARDKHDDWEILGKGEHPGVYSIIFSDIDSDIICHEVGHNYGLYTLATPHCDTCENYIDKDKFGPPPGGGGCPILYIF